MRQREILCDKVEERIAGMSGNVFLRADFADLGSYRQVGRALADLMCEQKLLRVSQGVYVRTYISPYTGEVFPIKGLTTLSEALERLGIETGMTRMQRDNYEGRSTQVPTGRVVGVKKPTRRKIGYGSFLLGFELI